jgi:signal transduction histidine kinase
MRCLSKEGVGFDEPRPDPFKVLLLTDGSEIEKSLIIALEKEGYTVMLADSPEAKDMKDMIAALRLGALGSVACCSSLAELTAILRETTAMKALALRAERAEFALRESEERHKQLLEQLIHAEKLASLGMLVSGMAHEINNPVHGILAMAEIILEERDPVKIKEYAEDIAGYSKHVAAVVHDCASYARPASRESPTQINLNNRLLEAVKMVRRNPRFGNVEVVTAFNPLPSLLGRRSEIDQIFVNLISNAVQAMQGDGRLTLATHAEADLISVSVTDTGIGIPQANLKHIFDPFFTTKEPGKGTGLGLSIVQKIVVKYKGTIIVESEEAKGTTFQVRFPAANTSAEESQHAAT